MTSTWYTKTTDTGLTMNFHALAPDRYKRSVVSGMVNRILRACSTWKALQESLEKSKKILANNQCPSLFFDPIIKKCLTNTLIKNVQEEESEPEVDEEYKMLFVQYRGRFSEKCERSLKKMKAPCKLIFTLRKVKTVLPFLKPWIEKALKCGVVYQIKCSR